MGQKKMYHRDDLQLKIISTFGGYEIENLFWSFSTYAVVTEKNGVFTDVIDGKTYLGKGVGEVSFPIGTERAMDALPSDHILLKNEMNSVDDIKRAMERSGLHFNQDLTTTPKALAFIKSFKR